MEAILLTKKMVVVADLASSEDGGRMRKEAEVQEEARGANMMGLMELGLVEVQSRTSEVSRSNNSKIQTSMTSKFDHLKNIYEWISLNKHY